MTSKKHPYESKTVTTSPWSKRKLRKALRQGWEVTSTSHRGLSGWHDHNLRRPNPKYQGDK